MRARDKYHMRKFINIVEKIVTAKPSTPEFGSTTLSRNTDPNEIINFKVFALPKDAAAVREIIDHFPVETTGREPTKMFAKTTFLCRGKRRDAEAVARSVKMARIDGALARID